MNATLINKDKTAVKFSFEVDAQVLETGLQHAYQKNKGKISIPGFRKGKVPRKIVEAQYGVNFFYEDAINYLFPDHYEEAVKELGLDVVSRPSLDIETIDVATGIKFIVDVTVKPDVTLGQYKGLAVEKTDVSVSDEQVLAEIKKVQEKNARKLELTEGAAQMDDIVNISFDGSIDGVPFEGGQADSHDLKLGSHAFIEGFEEQIVGHQIGDAFDVTVTFPTEYHAADLAGKPAVFAVVVKGITRLELPELDDSFAEDVSDFATLDEYKASVLDKLQKDMEENAKQLRGDQLLDMAISNCQMEVPAVMFDNKIDQLLRDFEENIGRQGLTLDIYCQYMGTSIDQLREHFRGTAEKSVRARLMLEQIAKEEGFAIAKEELDEEIGKVGANYGLDPEKMLEIFRDEDRESLEQDMVVRKAMKLIEDTAVEK